MKVKVLTLGCKVNQYESQALLCMLAKEGYETAAASESADICIVNSCTVTAESSRKTRSAVNRLRKEQPDAVLVLTGCYPQAFPEEAAACPADILLGNKNKLRLPAYLAAFFADRRRIVEVLPYGSDEKYCDASITGFAGHTRAFVKIQDGCNRFCSYCIIPAARGRSRSREPEDLRAELQTLAAGGFLEIVLTGINLSAYGRDIGCTLADAVDLAAATEGIRRVRLGSLEPDHITGELLRRLRDCPRFCGQFHLSLQSGSDTILRKMNRRYTTAEYAALCENIRCGFPDATITTDLITGFPGESETEFLETVAFAEKMRFEKAHIFPYSERSGTRAASLAGRVPQKVRAERAKRLGAVCDETRRHFLRTQIGKTVSVLFETPADGLQYGYTPNYMPVYVAAEKTLTGTLGDVLLTDVRADGCLGVLQL